MGWTEILAKLQASREQLDGQAEVFSLLVSSHRARIYCEKGCCNCCALTVNCSYPEALAISYYVSEDQQAAIADKIPQLTVMSQQAQDLTEFLRLFRQQLGGCPLLDKAEGCCGIYPQRPLSCRALLSTRNSDWCAVDFSGLHPLEKQAYLSSLDQELVAFPTHYLAASQDLGLELESATIASMQEQFGIGLSGNLIYQVWLEQEHRLSEVIAQGSGATRDYLAERKLDLRYLLRIHSGVDP